MLLDLYRYFHTIPLTNSNYSGKLENVAMFNDTLVLHKNVDNTFHIKITDRDRVTYTPDDDSESESSIKFLFRIIDERKVVVSKFYLDFINDGKYFKATIPKDKINELDSRTEYTFMVTIEETVEDTVTEMPLYTDHDFSGQGFIKVEDNFKDIETEVFTRTEVYQKTGTFGSPISEKEGKHFFNEIILNDGNIYDIEVKSIDDETQCAVTFEINNQGHYPANPRSEQWDTTATYYGIGTDTTSILTRIPERVYVRILIHTYDPDNFELHVSKISS